MSIKSILKDGGLDTFYKDKAKPKEKIEQWKKNKGNLIIGIKNEIGIMDGLLVRDDIDDYGKKMVKDVKKDGKKVYAFQFMLGSQNLVGRKEQRDKEGKIKTKLVDVKKDKVKIGDKEQTMYDGEFVYLGSVDNREECSNNLKKILEMVEGGKMDVEIEKVSKSLKRK
jgi:hypothetical protein